MRLALLVLLCSGAATLQAQPVRTPDAPARLTVEVMRSGTYRPVSATEHAATSGVTELDPWRVLIDGEPVSEQAFYLHAGQARLAEKAARQRRGAKQAIAGGVAAVVAGFVLIATSDSWPDTSPLASSQIGLGTSVSLLGTTVAVAGGFGMDRKATTVWDARGAANRYNERVEDASR